MLLALSLLALGADPSPPNLGPAEARNAIYAGLLRDGWSAAGATVSFAPPALGDGADEAAERAALAAVAGSEGKARELTRDSVTAPFVLKVRDLPAEGAVIRLADLWFVVHADLADLDLSAATARAGREPIEVGNMRFGASVLGPEDFKDAAQPPPEGVERTFAHLRGRLLDRVAVEATNRTEATRTPDTLVVASTTDRAFDADPRHPNRWAPIDRQGRQGDPEPYAGSASYTRVTRLRSVPGALLVECHLAFVEPRAWFDGAPILRSKIGLVAQDQIRRLRREVARPGPR